MFKQRNLVLKDLAKSVLDKDSRLDLAIKFICECSNEHCHEIIEMPIAEFERVRGNTRQFIVKAGHQQEDIESAIQFHGYLLVEKFEEPPPTDGTLNRTQ